MPSYTYLCKECGNQIEKILKINEVDSHVVNCPGCRQNMTRLIGCPEFKMAGAPPRGWKPLKKNSPKSEVRNIKEIKTHS